MSSSRRSGADQPPDLVWPADLQRDSPARLVYLDLNHFINLAKLIKGNPDVPPVYRDLLDAILRAKAAGRARFPLSMIHFIEMGQNGSPRQRADVTKVMEDISDFDALPTRSRIAEMEIEAVLDRILGTRTLLAPVPLVGFGISSALGLRGFRVRRGVADVTEEMRNTIGAGQFDGMLASAERSLTRALLAGPSTADLVSLRANGYAPEEIAKGAESRVDFERELVRILNADKDTNWRAGRLRDAVAARELIHEWNDALTRSMIRRSTTIGDVLEGDPAIERDRIRNFVESMPSTRVAVSIKTRYHANPLHPWKVNDVHDIDALSVAVAYCDAVITDKAARNAVQVSAELTALDCFMPRTIDALVDWLNALPQ
ncbi:hypothetical protein F1D05_19465 [Kribbella qitaiheensis]|uniref:Uncharacterized protein n=1 Tax=Kribbella qitaiheensis TaxID=1544730 RepID=A0A7G6X0D7_9ACTN|nr:hypothetical protein [Kribbella qitaiheensis]QNE19702.1 hypothetical protein F1D05_19465 [Kribbella qitaiheensis]